MLSFRFLNEACPRMSLNALRSSSASVDVEKVSMMALGESLRIVLRTEFRLSNHQTKRATA